MSVISDDPSSDMASSNISSFQNNQDHAPESQNTEENTIEPEMETFSTSKEKVDLGRMMSQQGPIQLRVMCHCRGMCLKACDCRTAGQSCGVRCGCSRDKCQWQ